jgi:hypothetical protein
MKSTVVLVARLAAMAALAGSGVTGCAGDAGLGEECDESGVQAGECEDGTICGQDAAGELVCLKICYTQTDCLPDQECNGVGDSTFKGCRSK